MDAMRDQDDFYGLLDQLSVTWTGFPAKDEMRQAYWGALRDARLSEVRGNVERILRTATGRQPFPKPAELRNVPPHEATPIAEANFQAAEARCIGNLEGLRKEDPDRWRREVQQRQLDRIIATQHPGSSMYEAAFNEWKRP